MVSANEIISFVDCLVARFTPQRVVLFGSYAYGKPDNDSDVDLLITRRHRSMSPLTAAGRMRIELGVPFAMDLIVRSQADIEQRAAHGDSFVAEILQKGIILYAADDARLGSQGRIRLRRRSISRNVGDTRRISNWNSQLPSIPIRRQTIPRT